MSKIIKLLQPQAPVAGVSDKLYFAYLRSIERTNMALIANQNPQAPGATPAPAGLGSTFAGIMPTCKQCNNSFKSKNDLFRHLKANPTHHRSLTNKKQPVPKDQPGRNCYSLDRGSNTLYFPLAPKDGSTSKGKTFTKPRGERPPSANNLSFLSQKSAQVIKQRVAATRPMNPSNPFCKPTVRELKSMTINEIRAQMQSEVSQKATEDYMHRFILPAPKAPVTSSQDPSSQKDAPLDKAAPLKFSTPPIYFPSEFTETSSQGHARRESLFTRIGDNELFDSE